ncbi:hypothetical protein VMCG_06717 [Cytospora schulzeri]|uniref:Phytanoyl-CoA dioxygenase n=1 Tax=Cytospora schulzeri TaxID=448051 RepID=A0A423W5X9_9PEZI|nr:hypothetical protein VMCG_06717 [Valsa malicola]
MSDSQTEAKTHLKEQGCVRIPSVLSKNEGTHALDRLWKAKAAVEAESEDTYLQFLDPNPSNVRIFYLMAIVKIFRDSILHPTAIEMVKSVLGGGLLFQTSRPTSPVRWTTRQKAPENAPELLVYFEAKAGDILVVDGRVWHTSGSNVTRDQDRALLFGYYTGGFMRQQVNWTAKLSKEVQGSLTFEQKEWLGLGVIGNIGVTGDFRYMSAQYPGIK